MSEREGRRERRKRETRERISGVATTLFLRRGFDDVSVAEVADAADVSRMTVINYFPLKEDLVLDRAEEMAAVLAGAVAERDPGTPYARAVEDLMVRLTREAHPLSGARAGVHHFWRMVFGSPALRRRAAEIVFETERELARAMARDAAGGAHPGGLAPRLAAAQLVAVCRVLVLAAVHRVGAGENPDDFRDEHVADIHRAFAPVRAALGDLGG